MTQLANRAVENERRNDANVFTAFELAELVDEIERSIQSWRNPGAIVIDEDDLEAM